MGVVAPGIRGVIAVAGVGVSGALCGQFLSVPGMGSNVPAELGVFPMGQQAPGARRDSPERNRILDLFR